MKRRVILRGPGCVQSGYSVHFRQIARWALSRSDLECQFILTPWGNCDWMLDSSRCSGLIGEMLKRSAPEPWKDADLSIQVQLPSEWNHSLARINVGVTAGVETDRCNPAWIDCINRMSCIVVPSKHVERTFRNTGTITVPVHVIPEAFHDACASAHEASQFNFNTEFNFLVVGQLTGNNQATDRKNTFSTIKWLCEAFKDDADVGIVVKTNMGQNSCMDRQMTSNLMRQLLAEVRHSSPHPRVHLLHGDMTDAEMASLYGDPRIKALVTATRGEGFGLPILEAAACGLPVIATRWSGHLDFLSLGRFVELDYDMREVHPSKVDGQIFVQGVRWAEVKEESFKQRVLKFKKSPFIPKQWARELQSRLLTTHSFEAISAKYDELLKKVLP